MASTEKILKQLSTRARLSARRHRSKLDELKANHKDLKRSDFLWHYLLQSFSTMGNSRGWHGLIGNRANYNAIRYQELVKLTPGKRKLRIKDVCRAAKLRAHTMKAEYIIGCFERIEELGGLKAATKALFAQDGRDEKICFLRTFPGIGEKYSRNIMMDVYDEDFRDSIAIDERIKGISKAWGLKFQNYSQAEEFFLEVARVAKIEGWELDRLMYNFSQEFFPGGEQSRTSPKVPSIQPRSKRVKASQTRVPAYRQPTVRPTEQSTSQISVVPKLFP